MGGLVDLCTRTPLQTVYFDAGGYKTVLAVWHNVAHTGRAPVFGALTALARRSSRG